MLTSCNPLVRREKGFEGKFGIKGCVPRGDSARQNAAHRLRGGEPPGLFWTNPAVMMPPRELSPRDRLLGLAKIRIEQVEHLILIAGVREWPSRCEHKKSPQEQTVCENKSAGSRIANVCGGFALARVTYPWLYKKRVRFPVRRHFDEVRRTVSERPRLCGEAHLCVCCGRYREQEDGGK